MNRPISTKNIPYTENIIHCKNLNQTAVTNEEQQQAGEHSEQKPKRPKHAKNREAARTEGRATLGPIKPKPRRREDPGVDAPEAASPGRQHPKRRTESDRGRIARSQAAQPTSDVETRLRGGQ